MKNNPTDCYTLHIASSAFQIPDKPSPEERLLALLDVLSGSATFKPWLQNAPSSLVRSPCWPCWGWGTGQETSCIPLRPSVPAVLCQCFLHLILTSVWMGVPQKATEVFMQSDTHFAHIWKATGFPWCPVVGQSTNSTHRWPGWPASSFRGGPDCFQSVHRGNFNGRLQPDQQLFNTNSSKHDEQWQTDAVLISRGPKWWGCTQTSSLGWAFQNRENPCTRSLFCCYLLCSEIQCFPRTAAATFPSALCLTCSDSRIFRTGQPNSRALYQSVNKLQYLDCIPRSNISAALLFIRPHQHLRRDNILISTSKIFCNITHPSHLKYLFNRLHLGT